MGRVDGWASVELLRTVVRRLNRSYRATPAQRLTAFARLATDFWTWRKQVLDGDIDGARRNGSIVLYDSMQAVVKYSNGASVSLRSSLAASIPSG